LILMATHREETKPHHCPLLIGEGDLIPPLREEEKGGVLIIRRLVPMLMVGSYSYCLKSTLGTARLVSSTWKYSFGVKPKFLAKRVAGKVCWALLKLMTESL